MLNRGDAGGSAGREGDVETGVLLDSEERGHEEGVDPRGRVKQAPWHQRVMLSDWVVCGMLLAVSAVVRLFEPFHQLVTPGDPHLSFPVSHETVPTWLVTLLGIGVPVSVWYLQSRFIKYDPRELLRSTLGLAESISLTVCLTACMKNVAGRPRPNFFELCKYSDGACRGSASNIAKAFRSFPSGHSSFAFSSLFFLTLWLMGKSRVMKSSSMQFGRLLLCLTPTGLALFIALTRTRDSWHHFSDIVAGAVIGAFIALCVYHLHFRSIFCDVHLKETVDGNKNSQTRNVAV
ncbi:SHSP domain-containing protein [Plasmodiophora brassicae]